MRQSLETKKKAVAQMTNLSYIISYVFCVKRPDCQTRTPLMSWPCAFKAVFPHFCRQEGRISSFLEDRILPLPTII